MGLGSGLVNLFKSWGKGIGNAADHVWLGADAQKAIRDEVTKKFQPKIDRVHTAESKRADNIKDLDAKVNQSKKDLADAKKAWKDKYDNALADAKNQRQADIDAYKTQLQGYQDALANAKAGRQSILDQLKYNEANYNPYKTIFTDVNTGTRYVFNPSIGKYEELSTFYNKLKSKDQRAFDNNIQSYDNRLFDVNTNRVINAFDESNKKLYKGYSIFDNYYPNKISPQDAVALRDAENQITRARGDLNNWQKQPQSKLQAWNDKVDLNQFDADFRKNNVEPTEYSFNGQNYLKEADLNKAYQKALNHAQTKRDYFKTKASDYASERDAEIAQRIQDAKDMNKAKVALGLGTAGALAGATYAAFSGDDNSNTKPVSPTVTPQTTEDIETQFEHPAETDSISGISHRDQEAALADMAFKAASESDDTPAETHPETPELAELSADDIHTNEGIGTRRSMNEGLFSVIKALQDPHQANAVADYIYSRYGNDPELQQLGWRAWLNKYYGDALRSQMNLDASGYNGMHIA